MPTTQAFQLNFPIAPGEAARMVFGTLWTMATGLPWWCYVIIVVAVAARLIAGKPLGQ